jgi:hypothetical protein
MYSDRGFDREAKAALLRLLEAGDFGAAQRLLEERQPRDEDQEFEHALLAGHTASLLGQNRAGTGIWSTA